MASARIRSRKGEKRRRGLARAARGGSAEVRRATTSSEKLAVRSPAAMASPINVSLSYQEQTKECRPGFGQTVTIVASVRPRTRRQSSDRRKYTKCNAARDN